MMVGVVRHPNSQMLKRRRIKVHDTYIENVVYFLILKNLKG